MDHEFEAELLSIVDYALASERTKEAFKSWRLRYKAFFEEGYGRATTHVAQRIILERDKLYIPPELGAALDKLLPEPQRSEFFDVEEWMEWTITDEFVLEPQDRKDGYRSLEEFWDFLSNWRSAYRERFGR